MSVSPAILEGLRRIPDLEIVLDPILASYTRFGIGGQAQLLIESSRPLPFKAAYGLVLNYDLPHQIIGAGSNLIVADQGFEGVILRYTGSALDYGNDSLYVEAGAILQDVVDRSIALGFKGMETMTGIPGCLGAAIYGNAGAYGNSIDQRVDRVWFTDGETVLSFSNAECEFHYRESIFKRHKEWVILSSQMRFEPGDSSKLAETARNIRTIRDAKYPPTMKCAGSIFKNVFWAELPEAAQREVPYSQIREGKVPSAWFLEQVGAKGMRRGDIQVAAYHANLIYNDGAGKASDLVQVIEDLKDRVQRRFGFVLQEEVQYIGFEFASAGGR